MSLLQLWHATPDQLLSKHLHQIIAFAGEGKLRDGTTASTEFRAFLAEAPSELLVKFIKECLDEGFPDSGFALQDVVNEVGHRLGFAVTSGAYQGRQGKIGYDGVWKLPTDHSVVVEVKTTDAYRIDTSRLAEYRRALAAEGMVAEDASSILLVVGRQDTGDLEAQIRGSRYAWEIRVISADALLRLMSLKLELDDPRTIGRICEILIPKEYTRLDEIVDLVFSTAEEIKPEEAASADESVDPNAEDEPRRKPVAFQAECVSRFAARSKVVIVKRTGSTYAEPGGEVRVVCAASKAHRQRGHDNFWFSFHPHQDEFLKASKKGFLVLGCGSPTRVLGIPYARLSGWLPDFWTTEREPGSSYWHLRIHLDGERLWLDRKEGKGRIDVSEFLLPNEIRRTGA